MVPELYKLRRFALGIGLVLLSYSLAGIGLEPGGKASLFGIPFVIGRPELLPLGLIIASFYGLFRFYYYGIMLRDSPRHYRRTILSTLYPIEQKDKDRIFVYFGTSRFRALSSFSNRDRAKVYAKKVTEAFPKFAGKKVSTKIMPYQGYDEEKNKEYIYYNLNLVIPRWCKIAAIIQDIDYLSPIWLNVVALVLAILRLF